MKNYQYFALCAFLLITGCLGVLFGTPPYTISAPERVIVTNTTNGGAFNISVRNFRFDSMSLSYEGDCCSLPRSEMVGPLGSTQFAVKIDTTGYGNSNIRKNVALKVKQGSIQRVVRIPYILSVKGQ